MVLCARCETPAYHVEQVVGPAGKIYHKQCLRCTSCSKRLDSHLLVEHDTQPYCKTCHLKLFGTRDLRHFNHPSAPSSSSVSTPSSPAPPQSLAAPAFAQSYLKPKPAVPPKPDFASKPRPVASDSPTPPTEDKLVIEPVRERSAASLAVMGGNPRNAGRFGAAAPAARAAWRVESGNEKCGGCGKTVYPAEQVIALNRKFHRGCLRCSVCSSTLPPSKVSDHDGHIFCAKCHTERFGGGYAMR